VAYQAGISQISQYVKHREKYMATRRYAALGLLLGFLAGACTTQAVSAPQPTQTRSAEPTREAAVSTPTPVPAQPRVEPSGPSQPQTATPLRFSIVPEATEARFRVREQLAGMQLPNDAVGTTRAVQGTIVFGPSGEIVREQSKVIVDLNSLRTDQPMRDAFIKQNTLQTQRYPTAEFVPHTAQGLPWPLPASGEAAFQLIGELTIHGVTRTVTWDVRARFTGQEVRGIATTSVTFGDFGMTQPRVARVLSIEDNIRLELEFAMLAA
jgi:polyisoprenoid-binding protein YceI